MKKGGSRLADVLGWLLKIVASLVALSIPLLGVWAGSSLAAYANGPRWVALSAGALAFPIAPLAWDAISEIRRRNDERKRILTFFDRIVLRTLLMNGVFLAVFLASAPELVFTAISTRGDWMLDEVQGSAAKQGRAGLLEVADKLAWLYELAHDNPYTRETREGDEPPPPDPQPIPTNAETRAVEDEVAVATGTEPPSTRAQPIAPARTGPSAERPWPSERTMHPLVANMPDEHRASIESVARFIHEHEPDPFLRVKALHDFVADRVSYDVDSLRAHERGGPTAPQDPETVFRTGLGVCAGYALLMEALGDVTGDDIRYIAGDARGDDASHAWNAVQIDGRFYLIDATWDAGYVNEGGFTKRYSTAYLFTPAVVFGIGHFPEEAGWQLRAEKLTRGEFNRQPDLQPDFFARGYRLVSPNRAQVDVDGELEVVLEVPRDRHAAVWAAREGGTANVECGWKGGGHQVFSCALSSAGVYTVYVGDSATRFGSYEGLGSIEATVR